MQAKDIVGKTVVLTGKFSEVSRAEAEDALARLGALIGSGISKHTDILFVGEKAGSKLAKARTLGVEIADEATLVALLAGAPASASAPSPKASAAKQASAKQAPAAAETSEISQVAAELKAFVQALKKRKDIRVEIAKLGRKAGKSKLASLHSAKLPAQLLEMYSELDGIHIEWRFVEPGGGGCIRVPSISQWTYFSGDDNHYMNFGDDREAILLDEITPEGSTWLVRGVNPKTKEQIDNVQIIFASAAEGREGVSAGGSIVEYLRNAMASGLVHYWPRCFKTNRHVSYSDQESWVERFRAAPVAPSKIRAGGRVQFSYFSEGGRGEVLVAEHVAPTSDLTEFNGPKYAQVKLDEGTTAWLPHQSIKAWAKVDAYERLRDPSFDFAAAAKADLVGLFDDLVRAIDPLGHVTNAGWGSYPSNGRRAAGLLSTRSLAEAVEIVVELRQAVTRAKLEIGTDRSLLETGDEFARTTLSRFSWRYTLDSVFTGLFGGLLILAHHESARRGIPGAQLLDSALVGKLRKLGHAAGLRESCASDALLKVPEWGFDLTKRAETLGLPAGAIALIGTGF
jgi:hypothetical protein